jgi:hypothetical protein
MHEKESFHEILVDLPQVFPEIASRLLGSLGLRGGLHEYRFVRRPLTVDDYQKGLRTPLVIEIESLHPDRPGAVIDVDSLHSWPA